MENVVSTVGVSPVGSVSNIFTEATDSAHVGDVQISVVRGYEPSPLIESTYSSCLGSAHLEVPIP